jgi:sec-independent protein translocase protein TatA
MGNLGMPELMMIMLLALLLFGPKKLPEIGKQVGKALGEFKRASNDLKRSIQDEMDKAQAGLDSISNEPPKPEPKPETTPEAPALAPAAGAVAQQKAAEPATPSTPTTPS